MNVPKTLTVSAILLAALTLSGCSEISTLLNGEGDVFSLEVGDCMNDTGETTDISSVPIIDCAEEHDAEVYATKDIKGDSYPGRDEVDVAADKICVDEFEKFTGIDYEAPEAVLLVYWVLTPSEETWGVGDREVVCSIVQYDENSEVVKVTGSLKGAK
jgi:hypothetical protein